MNCSKRCAQGRNVRLTRSHSKKHASVRPHGLEACFSISSQEEGSLFFGCEPLGYVGNFFTLQLVFE